ncbi:hypothetical protein HYZ98_00915 [Candidatus Peregrinibacteria bacterium]|nr:hypothetical protein [Candidatus Peregrinibacteria bacterium]
MSGNKGGTKMPARQNLLRPPCGLLYKTLQGFGSGSSTPKAGLPLHPPVARHSRPLSIAPLIVSGFSFSGAERSQKCGAVVACQPKQQYLFYN